MANIAPTVTIPPGAGSGNTVVIATWGPMQNGDVGLPAVTTSPGLALFADTSVQVVGTFGAGGSVAFEGSNDGVNYAALHDPEGNTIALTAASPLKAILENVMNDRPHVTAGDGTTSLTVTALYRRASPWQ